VKRYLVIQTAFIGDVILCTPVITELKRLYPDAHIDMVVRKGNESLVANHPDISQLFVWNKKKGKYKSLLQTIRAIRNYKYEEVINLQRYASAGLICRFTKAKHKVGFEKNSFPFIYSRRVPHQIGDGTHEVERNLSTIAHHKGARAKVRPQICPKEEDKRTVETYKTNRYYCIAPASVWYTKQLPIEKWIELCQYLCKKGIVYIVGGPADQNLGEQLQNAVNHQNLHNLCGELTLLESAALMKDAVMNYVNDSGPMHLASAVNAPTRAFFCSTIPEFGFGPLAEDAKIIETAQELPCRPCGLHGYKACPKGHFKCGTTINIKSIAVDQ